MCVMYGHCDQSSQRPIHLDHCNWPLITKLCLFSIQLMSFADTSVIVICKTGGVSEYIYI